MVYFSIRLKTLIFIAIFSLVALWYGKGKQVSDGPVALHSDLSCVIIN